MKTRRSPDVPVVIAWLAALLIRLLGWRGAGELPDMPKMVMTAAPHTANFDGVIMVLFALRMRTRIYWLGKHTLFNTWYGWFMRLMGGIPVDRRAPQGLVAQVVQVFEERERLILVVPPEGKRARADYWHTGFYYMAHNAGVPIVMGYIDYPTKTVGVGPVFHTTGDIEADLEHFRDFYTPIQGRYPELQGEIRVRPPQENPPS